MTTATPFFIIPASVRSKTPTELSELAKQGDLDAKCALATRHLLQGNVQVAINLYKEAASKLHLETIYCLANLRASGWKEIEQDLSSSVRMLKYLACCDHVPGLLLLARCYKCGERGVEQDYTEAVTLYTRAAEKEK